MNLRRRHSRPLRLAADLTGVREERLADYFQKAHVAVRLEPGFGASRDARETFWLALNMTLRVCPEVTVILPPETHDLEAGSRDLAIAIRGTQIGVHIIRQDPSWHGFDAVLNIGRNCRDDLAWITVNSTGWVARMAVALSGELHWTAGRYNAIGALAAACLGVSQVFMVLARQSESPVQMEISLFTYEVARPGQLDQGPGLPDEALRLDAILVGCGGVGNGWAYTVSRLPIVGNIEAVDRQAVRDENLGPYVGAFIENLGTPKTAVIRDLLKPKIGVTERPEEFELFKIRLNLDLVPLAPLVIAGLDNIPARHSLQRLWPRTLIDMASGGATSQAIVKIADQEGICLLEALRQRADERDYAEVLATATGLSADRIRHSATEPISDRDVQCAPEALRASLAEAKRHGQLICGRLTDYNLREEPYAQEFAAAAPFVTAFSGVVGAAETMRCLMGHLQPLHYQFDFRSLMGRALTMRCAEACECQDRTRTA
jgi:tRNA A37 threonylcarbamoyladenosine dehydratase